MRGVFVFFVSMCADLPASPGVLVCVCRHVCKATNTTHECKHTHTHTNAHALTGRTRVAMAMRTDVNKRGSRVNIVSLLSSRVQFISM